MVLSVLLQVLGWLGVAAGIVVALFVPPERGGGLELGAGGALGGLLFAAAGAGLGLLREIADRLDRAPARASIEAASPGGTSAERAAEIDAQITGDGRRR
jgi:hypothetical protein